MSLSVSTRDAVLLAIGESLVADSVDRSALTRVLEDAANEQTLARVAAQWTTWTELALAGISEAVLAWSTQVTLTGVGIHGAVAIGSPGCFEAPDLELISHITNAGVPRKIAKGFDRAISPQWDAWRAGLMIPGLMWYPTFAHYPAYYAPPTPNVPFPLVAIPSDTLGGLAGGLRARLGEELEAHIDSDTARDALDLFASMFYIRFMVWTAKTRIVGAIGSGPTSSSAGTWGIFWYGVINGTVEENTPVLEPHVF